MRYVIKEETLTSLGNAIRYKAGIEDRLSISQMISTIDGLITTTENPYNFKIVGGTTQPTSPSENTIWINTNVAIGEWQFNGSKPTKRSDGSTLVAGDIYINITNTSTIKFNAFKKNGIILALFTAYQYDGSDWAGKTSSIYMNGAWVPLLSDILNPSQGVDVTGGMSKISGKTGMVSKTSTGYRVTQDVSSGDVVSFGLYTNYKIDVTNISTLTFTFSNNVKFGSSDITGFYLLDDIPTSTSVVTSYAALASFLSHNEQLTTVGKNTISLDVSSLTGSYYIYFRAYVTAKQDLNNAYLEVNSITSA